MTSGGPVICSNCGFHNEPGDEFCGNCGRFLEFSGVTQAPDGQPSSGDQGPAGDGPAADQTAAGAGQAAGPSRSESPTGIQPPITPIPAPTPPPYNATGRGPAPDVICWNCGRRNPAGRAFCMQCGTKLTTGAGTGRAAVGGAATGSGAVGGAPIGGTVGGASVGGGQTYKTAVAGPTSSSGRRTLAIGAGIIALLLLLSVAGAAVLGLLTGPPPGSGLVALVTPSPSAGSSLVAGLSPGLFSLPPSSDLPTTPPSFAVDTLPPPSGTPKPPRTPRPTRTPTPTPTAQPTPVSCAASTQADRSVTLTIDFPTRTVPQHFAWCVHKVTFTNTSLPGATGTLKLYLENPEYVGPPGNYGMAKIGWPGPCEASIENNFGTSNTYQPTCDYPFGYDAITAGTIVSFQIDNCGTNGTCGGTVTIEFERIPAP